MLKRVDDYRDGVIPLGKLVTDLRGLYEAADIHEGETRRAFRIPLVTHRWRARVENRVLGPSGSRK